MPKLREIAKQQSLPKMLGVYLDGLDAAVDGRGFGQEHELARRYVEDAVRYATVRRDALKQIGNWPANGNSEPDVMACAIEAMKDLARAALGEAV